MVPGFRSRCAHQGLCHLQSKNEADKLEQLVATCRYRLIQCIPIFFCKIPRKSVLSREAM